MMDYNEAFDAILALLVTIGQQAGQHYPLAVTILGVIGTVASSATTIIGGLLALAPAFRALARLTDWTTRDDLAVSAATRWLESAAGWLDRVNRHVPRVALGKNVQKQKG